MKKYLTLSAIILLAAIHTNAQLNDEQPRKLSYFFNGGIGLYIPMKTHGALSQTGFASSFQFQVDYKKHFFGRLFFDQYNIAFHTTYATTDGSTLFISGKLPSSMPGLEIGYRWHIKKLSPYIYAGTGVAITDVPFLEASETSNDVSLTSDSRSSLAVRGGAGVTYKLSKFFILYFESQLMTFPISTQIYHGNLDGICLQVGFKTPLQ